MDTGPFGIGCFLVCLFEVNVLLQHDECSSTNHGNLLATILVRHSQIGTLQVLPHSRCLRFSFFVKGSWDPGAFQEFSGYLSESIEALVFLAGKELSVMELRVLEYGDFSVIELDRDMASISPQEISLVVLLLQEQFGSELVASDNDGDIEDVAWYDDFIQHVLEDINGGTPLDELIGFREGSRILVFNKSHASGNS